MTLDEFVNNELKRLNSFKQSWLENHELNPKSFTLDLDNIEEWTYQYNIFEE